VYDSLDYAISAAEKLMSSELSEAKKDEEVKSDKFTIGTDKSNPLHPSFFVYNTETGEKSKVFKTKKEAEELMNSKLNEAKKDEEVEDIKDVDVTVGDEETTADVTTVDVDPNVKAVQDALTQAQAAAEKLGDDKLTDQIGNTITFFTRTHVVEKPGMTAESNIKERINKLVKSLNETAVDEEKDTDTLTQKDIKALYSKGFNIIAPPDWNFVRIQKDFKSLKADWRFLNNLLSSKNIPSDIDYWRGDGDKGRNKRLEISKKYFDQNIKYPAFK
jgi:hypothetical protein